MERKFQPWPVKEDRYLLDNLDNMQIKEIATNLGRSFNSVRQRLFLIRENSRDFEKRRAKHKADKMHNEMVLHHTRVSVSNALKRIGL